MHLQTRALGAQRASHHRLCSGNSAHAPLRRGQRAAAPCGARRGHSNARAPSVAPRAVVAPETSLGGPDAGSHLAVPPQQPTTGLRAVVCGSGVAGLAAARVLSDHFDEVLLLERDAPLLDGPEAGVPEDAAGGAPPSLAEASQVAAGRRRGVPQWAQPHVMLTRGLQELEALFPGLRSELTAAGAVDVPTPSAWRIYDGRMGGELAHDYVVFNMLTATRCLVETELRVRVARDCPNVRTFSGAVVEGLETEGAAGSPQGHVTGVRLRGGASIAADLVVDASGRGSRTPKWLQAAGWAPPETVTVDSHLVYTSAVYELDPAAIEAGKTSVMVYVKPPESRSGLLLPIEGGRHHMILAGRSAERCEGTDEAIAAFVGGLPHPGLADALRGAKRVSDIRVYERTANFRRKYEDLEMPGGLVVMGDGVCAFNPIYGQGMSVAVLEAVALGKQMGSNLPARAGAASAAAAAAPDAAWLSSARRALPSATRVFMRGVGSILEVPWALATGSDAPFVPGFKRGPVETIINDVFVEVGKLSQRDAEVHAQLMRVMHMLDPPTALIAPKMLLKLAADKVKTALGGGARAEQGAAA